MAGVGDALWALKTERKDEGAGGTKETCWRRVQTRWTRRALCAILGAHVPAVAASIMGAYCTAARTCLHAACVCPENILAWTIPAHASL